MENILSLLIWLPIVGMGVIAFVPRDKNDLIRKAKQISRSKNLNKELRDLLRKIRHKNYISESKFRRKFIIQEYIPELKNDWKVYFFG